MRRRCVSVGDEYNVEWRDGDRQRYQVVAIAGDKITFRRWMTGRGVWTPWTGTHFYSEISKFILE